MISLTLNNVKSSNRPISNAEASKMQEALQSADRARPLISEEMNIYQKVGKANNYQGLLLNGCMWL